MEYTKLITLFHKINQDKCSLIATFIDFGQQGLAHCTANIAPGIPVITELKLHSDVGNITNAKMAVEVMFDLYNTVIKDKCDILVVECQPAINRKMCMLESALAGIFVGDSLNNQRLIYHHPAWSVKKEFSLPNGYTAKKAAGTKLACEFLANKTQIGFDNPNILNAMIDSKRLHDMADTILMMVQFSRLLHNRLKCPISHLQYMDNMPLPKRLKRVSSCYQQKKKTKQIKKKYK